MPDEGLSEEVRRLADRITVLRDGKNVGTQSISELDPRTLARWMVGRDIIDLLVRSTLAERRPVDELETIRSMLEHAGVIITARIAGRLVGIARDHRFQLLHLSVRPGR